MEALIKVNIEQVENGEYLVTSDEIPDLLAQGRTVSEALEIATDVSRKLYELYLEKGIKMPAVFREIENNAKAAIPVSISS